METALSYIVTLALVVLLIVQLVTAPKSWGTREFYRQTWALLTRDAQRDTSLDRRIILSNGAGVVALLLVAAYMITFG